MSQHSVALIGLNSIQGTNMRRSSQNCSATVQAAYRATSCYYLLHQIAEKSLFWVHTDVVRQNHSVYVYLLLTAASYDVNTPVQKLPSPGHQPASELKLSS